MEKLDYNMNLTHYGAAGKLICPFIKDSRGPGNACLSNLCMAWRYAKYSEDGGRTLVSDVYGYCGAAGAPRQQI